MTAEGAQSVRIPPRLFVRTAWLLHRALLRFSGGRFGLSRPEAGRKFGMLRLSTVGRRSGQPRMTMIGYYPDGENLVTLAMNGWADAEPAWWLNLQAHPAATVQLTGEASTDVDGDDLLPLLSGDASSWRNVAVSDYVQWLPAPARSAGPALPPRPRAPRPLSGARAGDRGCGGRRPAPNEGGEW